MKSPIQQAADEMENQVKDSNEQIKKSLAVLKSIPGGEGLLRRELARFNLRPEVVERLLRGEILPEDATVLAGFKIDLN